MTNKPFAELQIGDCVADMHYGIAPLRDRFTVVSHVQWEEPSYGDYKGPERAFYVYLQQFLAGHGGYMNKALVVMDYAGDSTQTKPVVIAGYCYDGRRAGIVTLAEK